jgi:hypothetical protein
MSVGGIYPVATPGRTIAFPSDRSALAPDRPDHFDHAAPVADRLDPQRTHESNIAAERAQAARADAARKELQREEAPKPAPLPPLKALTVAEIRAMLGIAPVLPKPKPEGAPPPPGAGAGAGSGVGAGAGPGTPAIPAAALDRYRSEEIR